jgi:alkylated DNA repair dioxygenase AlkB
MFDNSFLTCWRERRHLASGELESDVIAPNSPNVLVGFEYQADFLSPQECGPLLAAIGKLPLAHARYKQFTAKRRVMHFGGRYDFSNNELLPAGPIPEVLLPVRQRVAALAGLQPEDFSHAMAAEYSPGVQLGWHRDVPDFEVVAGVSLGSSARLQFRPYPPQAISRKQYFNAPVDPGSLYILRGPARWEWQHRVPPVPGLRYSITFRTLRTRQ